MIHWQPWERHSIERPVDIAPQMLARTGARERWFEVRGDKWRMGLSK